jgi:membrane dipeptidase
MKSSYGTDDSRVRDLHFNSFVFDYTPFGEPVMVVSDEEKQIMENMIEEGHSFRAIRSRLMDNRIRQVERDRAFDEELGRIWKLSGVNCVTVTIGSDFSNIARWNRLIEVSSYLVHCKTADDMKKAYREGKIGIIYNLQDGSFMERDLENLEILYNLGFRIIQLTYNLRNLIGDGCTERKGAGLSHHGVVVVKKMNELGIIVDLSHCCYTTTMDAIEISQRPVAFTHSFCKAVYDHDRGKEDDLLKALAENDGYMGILTLPVFLTPDGNDSFDVFLRHLEHACTILGPERVGIGTDWVGGAEDIPFRLQEIRNKENRKSGWRPEHGLRPGVTIGKMKSFLDWSYITESLLCGEFSDDEVKGFIGLNFLNFMQRSIS